MHRFALVAVDAMGVSDRLGQGARGRPRPKARATDRADAARHLVLSLERVIGP
jgi:hypothetical protein